jgi:hypothetical protein
MKTAFLVYFVDIVSGGMDGGAFERDHIVCLTEESRDREMARLLAETKAEYEADSGEEWEPYYSEKLCEKEGPRFRKVKVVE